MNLMRTTQVRIQSFPAAPIVEPLSRDETDLDVTNPAHPSHGSGKAGPNKNKSDQR
jgi:hypothetical protein